ncbi:hypothetical protein pb186bvf_008419 [Paramecium bursaria]
MQEQQYNQLLKSFQEIVSLCTDEYQLDDFKVYEAPSIEKSLQIIESQDIGKKQFNKDELDDIDDEMIVTTSYIQKVLKNIKQKNIKQESINCAAELILQPIPKLNELKDKLLKCKLYSYQMMLNLDYKVNWYQQQNILQKKQQKEESEINEIFMVHISIYHPFTQKKTQEIIAARDATFAEIVNQIECPVNLSEEKFYSEEYINFEQPKFDFCELNQRIDQVDFQLCKQYYFIHLNQCKHRLYIHEIRSRKSSDKRIETIVKAPLKIRSCEVCGRSAQRFRVSDKLVPGQILIITIFL